MQSSFDLKGSAFPYQPIQKLFWDIYPYKVQVHDKLEIPRSYYIIDTQNYAEWQQYRDAKNKFYGGLRKYCAKFDSWKSMKNGTSFSFFFANSADARAFIKKYKEYIFVVYRPENEDQIGALSKKNQNGKLVLRDTLYYAGPQNKGYRFCIEFNEQYKKEDEDYIDEVVMGSFGDRKDKRRYFYTYSKRRRLYLNKESDICLIVLALFDKIKIRTEVLLKKDI